MFYFPLVLKGMCHYADVEGNFVARRLKQMGRKASQAASPFFSARSHVHWLCRKVAAVRD